MLTENNLFRPARLSESRLTFPLLLYALDNERSSSGDVVPSKASVVPTASVVSVAFVVTSAWLVSDVSGISVVSGASVVWTKPPETAGQKADEAGVGSFEN